MGNKFCFQYQSQTEEKIKIEQQNIQKQQNIFKNERKVETCF